MKKIVASVLAGAISILSATSVCAKPLSDATPFAFKYCKGTVYDTSIVHEDDKNYDIYYFCRTYTSNVEEMRASYYHACYIEHYINNHWAGVEYICEFGYDGEHAR